MADAQPAETQTLKARVIRGSSISLINQLASQVLRLGSNMVLTRLLFPEAFGVMALVNTVLTGLEMLSDLGVSTSIVQHARGDERDFLDTAWTVQALRGLIMMLAGLIVAAPFASYYNEPDLLGLVALASLQALISGLWSTKLHSLNRHIQLGRVMAINLSGQLTSMAVMISVAYVYRSVYALVLGTLGFGLVQLALTHFWLKGPLNRFRWDKEAAKALIGFGKWIFLSTLLTFAAQKFDVLMLGKLVHLDRLGVYSIGSMLASLPMLVGGQVIGTVLMPALASAYREGHEAMISAYARAKRVIHVAQGFSTLGLVLCAPAFFEIMYDDRYLDAGWVVQLLMVGVWFISLELANGRALLAMGNARPLALTNAIKLLVAAPSAYAGFHFFGLPGFILGGAVGSLVGFAVISISLERLRVSSFAQDAKATLAVLAIGLFGGLMPGVLAGVTPVSLLVWRIVLPLLMLLPLGWWSAKTVLGEMKR